MKVTAKGLYERKMTLFVFIAVFLTAFSCGGLSVFAHCDTMEGPVISDAKKALESADVKRVLIWVQKSDEDYIKQVFERTLAVRKLGGQAKELADMYFFETLVRVHRVGEGEPYTGIKGEGAEIAHGIEAADKAVESGSVDGLVKAISSEVSKGVRERFAVLMEKKKHMNEGIEAGREYVKAYVIFIHYVEGLHTMVSGEYVHHEGKSHGEH